MNVGSITDFSPIDDIEIIWCGRRRRKCSCHMSHSDSRLSIVSPARNKLFWLLVQDDTIPGLVLLFSVLICVSQMPPGPAGPAGEEQLF